MAFEVGAIVEGVVVGITNFGAFVELPDGKTGLVHISEFSDSYVQDIRSFVKERDKVKVKIIGINEKGKYDLSIRQAEPTSGKFRKKTSRSYEESEIMKDEKALSFEDKLAKFLKESEERLLDLKKNVEAKRGRGKAR